MHVSFLPYTEAGISMPKHHRPPKCGEAHHRIQDIHANADEVRKVPQSEKMSIAPVGSNNRAGTQ
jgi:ribosomal protein L34E